jgi:hypothetical protein
VDTLVEQHFFYRGEQVIGQQGNKDERITAVFFLMKDWPDDER